MVAGTARHQHDGTRRAEQRSHVLLLRAHPSGREWAGNFGTSVPEVSFDQCWNIGDSASIGVSMREIQVALTSFSYTVNLIV